MKGNLSTYRAVLVDKDFVTIHKNRNPGLYFALQLTLTQLGFCLIAILINTTNATTVTPQHKVLLCTE